MPEDDHAPCFPKYMAQVQPLAAGPTYLYKLLALRQAYHVTESCAVCVC